jgi:glycine/D-amino acid oxidase-like deaminating enzyme
LWENVGRFKQEGLKLTTIAIIGGGIAARSLLYVMAKKKIREKILVFYSDDFASPCSLRSTAIVAPRGISPGHSPLGDMIHAGFLRFSRHIEEDKPHGVIKIPQYTGALTKLETFKKRYPAGEVRKIFGSDEIYFAEASAYLVRPEEYLGWLMEEGSKELDLEIISSYVTEVHEDKIRIQDGREFTAERILFTAGVQNDLWGAIFPGNKNSKTVQGSYLEFRDIHLQEESFSLTLEGNNLIYDRENKTLLIGSTTRETALELPPEKELSEIYQNLSERVKVKLPPLEKGLMKVGLREKASKREPYLLQHGRYAMLGGLYKNGYSLSLLMAEKLLSSSAHSG